MILRDVFLRGKAESVGDLTDLPSVHDAIAAVGADGINRDPKRLPLILAFLSGGKHAFAVARECGRLCLTVDNAVLFKHRQKAAPIHAASSWSIEAC